MGVERAESYRRNKPPLLEIPVKERITFKEICCEKNILKLKSPIQIEGELSSEGWIFYYKPLDILVCAPTLEDCMEDFQEEFYLLYEAYAKETDEKLTEVARQLKRELLDMSLEMSHTK